MSAILSGLAIANLVAIVSGHGLFTNPTPRPAGQAMAAACGQQAFSMRSSDPAGNIQGELQVTGSNSGFDASQCNVWLCAGHQFEDNTANIQSFTPGQEVQMTFDIKAPHTGIANVSIVDTASNSVIGSPLISFDNFADNAQPAQADQKDFSITIPSDLGDQCSTAGACVIQHFWDAPSAKQTYESCIDFTVGGSGGSASGSPPTAPSSGGSSPTSTAASPSGATPTATISSIATVSTTSASSSSTIASTANVSTPSTPPPSSTESSASPFFNTGSVDSSLSGSENPASGDTLVTGPEPTRQLNELVMRFLAQMLGVVDAPLKVRRNHARALKTYM